MDEEMAAVWVCMAAALVALALAVVGSCGEPGEAPDPWPIGTDWTF